MNKKLNNNKNNSSSKYYYNNLLNQNVSNDNEDNEQRIQEEQNKPLIKIYEDDEEEQYNNQNQSCFQKIKQILHSDKMIVVIAKFTVALTGMLGVLNLFIQSNDNDNDNDNENDINQTYFDVQQMSRNDYPFQKVLYRYMIMLLFLYYKQQNEKQPKNSRDFISNEIIESQSYKEGIVFGLLDYIQVQSFVFSLGYTSILRAYLFNSTQIIVLLLLKKKENAQIYKIEILAMIMGLFSQGFICMNRVDLLDNYDSMIYGDLISFLGGIVGSINLFYQSYKKKEYYQSIYINHTFSLIYAFIIVILFDNDGILINIKNIGIIIVVGVIECIAVLKKIKTFVFMKYFKNIFEPLIGFKFEFVFGFILLDSWTILIVFILCYIPANIIMMKKHGDDIREDKRIRDSTFIDVLNFEEYIEMKDINNNQDDHNHDDFNNIHNSQKDHNNNK